jgi:hypothetical protein
MMENAHRISFVGPVTPVGAGIEKRSAATVEKASKTRFPGRSGTACALLSRNVHPVGKKC